MLEAGQVHADLVGAPGADADFEQRVPGEAPQHPVLAPGRAAPREARGHAGAMHRIARDRPLDAPALRLHFALHQREVGLGHLAARELLGQAAVRGVILGHQQHAAGEAVQAVDDAGPHLAAHPGETREAVQQRVDQGSRMHSGAGVNHHARPAYRWPPGRHLRRAWRAECPRRWRAGEAARRVAPRRFRRRAACRRAGRGAVHAHVSALDPFLYAGAAGFGQTGVQPVVQALACVRGHPPGIARQVAGPAAFSVSPYHAGRRRAGSARLPLASELTSRRS